MFHQKKENKSQKREIYKPTSQLENSLSAQ